ncbi:hypothetical protein LO762_08370 [Actinocorallia sp. API 0066]|uniref:hypothetical protein n=1 Tax=Actinocorallia sp. API 0066 TaxID=2896846 RepID=UPI001E376881|nr:hypothetical protein [Actinocorallia sp. API 0066]MCD0449201.1 hypothetical protein [Actinocorallia sp. API 0066]
MTAGYTPEFQHTDWVDNVDKVRAAGDNGFNSRFRAIEEEFHRISKAVAALGTTPTPQPVNLTLTPTLTTLTDPWNHTYGGAIRTDGEAASGMMPVTLPQGAVIQALRVCGRKQQGALSICLRRQGLAPASSPEPLLEVLPMAGAFDRAERHNDGITVRNEQFRYFITAEFEGSDAASTVELTCFQITYLPS